MAREMNMLRTMHTTKRRKYDEYSERSRVLHTVYRSTEHSETPRSQSVGASAQMHLVIWVILEGIIFLNL